MTPGAVPVPPAIDSAPAAPASLPGPGHDLRHDDGRRRAPRVLAMALALLALSAGVAAALGGTSAPAIGPAGLTVEIVIHYSHYEPSAIAVPAGVPIRFVIRNLDPIDHEWIVGDAATHARHRTGTEAHHGARPTEVSIAALQTVETVVTFPVAGSLQYICHLPGHEQYGMVGTLTIR